MNRVALVMLLQISACFSPTFQDTQCGPGDSCPPGYACGVYACLPFDSSSDDGDRDGAHNASDNCLTVPNPSQANEDADALGDACDPCPPDASNADADGDKVGDACDPNPSTPGDRIAMFEGFSAGAPMNWHRSGEWTIEGDHLRIIPGQNTSAWLSTDVARGKHTITTLATFATEQSGALKSMGLIDEQTPNSDAGLICAIYIADSTQAPLASGAGVAVYRRDPSRIVGAATMPYEPPTGKMYRISLTADGTAHTCTGSRPGMTQSSRGSFGVDGLGFTGLYVHSVAAHYYWFMVVTSP